MKIKKIISKSKNGNRMEIIAINGEDLRTLHVHLIQDKWRYYAGKNEDFQPIFKFINI